MIRGIPAIAVAAVMLLPSGAHAVEALSTEELISHCTYFEKDPDGTDGVFCVRYIQGFCWTMNGRRTSHWRAISCIRPCVASSRASKMTTDE